MTILVLRPGAALGGRPLTRGADVCDAEDACQTGRTVFACGAPPAREAVWPVVPDRLHVSPLISVSTSPLCHKNDNSLR